MTVPYSPSSLKLLGDLSVRYSVSMSVNSLLSSQYKLLGRLSISTPTSTDSSPMDTGRRTYSPGSRRSTSLRSHKPSPNEY